MAIGTFGGTITLASVSDGADGGSHLIEINHNKIYKFYPQNSADPTYSPVAFTFKLTSGATVEPVSDYTTEISLIGTNSQINNIWALLGRLEGYPLEETETPQAENLLTATRIINSLTNTIGFNFVELFGYDIDKSELGNAQADITAFHNLLDMIRDENCYFIIEAFQNNSPISTAALPVEFGTSKDMAKFAVTANAIEAAVGESKLEFNVNGLTVRNGGLTIYNNENEEIFYYDNTEHLLYIVGNGTFTGEINATSGSFTGDVSADTLTANAGTIGGFVIQDSGLYSTDEDQSLKLLSNGRIDAENINLGASAHINRYLKLGDNAFIWNPDENENQYFIEVKDSNNIEVVTLDDNGVLKLGNITMDGRTSTISGDTFNITPSLASFSNISASGKISTAVFEQGHLQSAGGLMMFKPAYKIEARNGNVLTLDQEFQGQVGNYVYVIKDDGAPVSGLIQVTAKSSNTVTLNNIAYNGTLVSLIDVGAEGDLIVGINSSNTASTFLRPRGITISEFHLSQTDPEDPSTKYIDENITPKVFLGDLDTSGIAFSDTPRQTRGFGLYSENVYLTGSLTTKINSGDTEPRFAGVNTLDGTNATVFVEHSYGNDTSPIVFWAGSAGTEPQQIQAAPFQVTAEGSIYAMQGIFTGAIITESFISGADLYAARIHGTGTEQDGYGLAFFDCNKGLVFYGGSQSAVPSPTEIFSIGTTGLRKGNDYFVEVGASGVNFNGNNFRGNSYYTDRTQSSYIHLYQNSIIGAHTINENEESADANITFNQQGINFGVSNSTVTNITQNLIKMSTNSVQIDNTVLFGEQLKYEKVANGYNLFVLS